jgi:pimeloyl-ACP methyl ester carboxylesterase
VLLRDCGILPFRTSLSLISVTMMALTACSSISEHPEWFDAIHRTPIHRAVVDGHRIAYTDRGDGPPVILVHGFAGSMWQWEYQYPLAASFRVIIPDLLGAGLSDKPEIDYTPTQFVEFMRGFMDALQIPRASFVGNSMGAGIVMGMALTHPERVEKLVLIDGLPDHVREKVTSPSLQRALGPWPPLWVVEMANWFAGRGTTRSVLREMIYDDRLITPAVIDRSNRNRHRPGVMKAIRGTVKHLPLWEEGFATRFGEIGQPTLVIWGDKDAVFPPAVGVDLHHKIKASEFELIPEAGHLAMWERPDVINPRIQTFLKP